MASVEQESRIIATQSAETAKMLGTQTCKKEDQPVIASIEKEIGKYAGVTGLLTRLRTLDPFARHRDELKSKLAEEKAKEQACVANAVISSQVEAIRVVKKH